MNVKLDSYIDSKLKKKDIDFISVRSLFLTGVSKENACCGRKILLQP